MDVNRDELVIDEAGTLDVWLDEDSEADPGHRACGYTVRALDGALVTKKEVRTTVPRVREFTWRLLKGLEREPESYGHQTWTWAQLHRRGIREARQRVEDELFPPAHDAED